MSNEIRFVRIGDRIINLALVTNATFYCATDGTQTSLVIHFSGGSAIGLDGDDAERFWHVLNTFDS